MLIIVVVIVVNSVGVVVVDGAGKTTSWLPDNEDVSG